MLTEGDQSIDQLCLDPVLDDIEEAGISASCIYFSGYRLATCAIGKRGHVDDWNCLLTFVHATHQAPSNFYVLFMFKSRL